MITYELAKKLKDAVFPMLQRAAPDGLQEEGCYLLDGANYRIPTLSELIEACGSKFIALRRVANHQWFADGHGVLGGGGSTPEEAVANLWLAIHTSEGG